MAGKYSIFGEAGEPEEFIPEGGLTGAAGCARTLLAADLRTALARFGVRPADVFIVSAMAGPKDIVSQIRAHSARLGSSGALPFSTGAWGAKPSLTIVAAVPLSSGAVLSRIIEAGRRDLDIVCLVINGGCAQRAASYDRELASVAGSVGMSFIARCVPGEEECAQTLFDALRRRGFSFVEVVGTCGVCPGAQEADVPEMRGVLIEKEPRSGADSKAPGFKPAPRSAQEIDAAWTVFRC